MHWKFLYLKLFLNENFEIFIKFGIQNYYNEVINLILSLENKEQIFENLSSLLIILNNNYFKLLSLQKKNLLDKIFQTINNN